MRKRVRRTAARVGIVITLTLSILLSLMASLGVTTAAEPLTIAGSVSYKDQSGGENPAAYVKVEVHENNVISNPKIAEGYTDSSGHFTFSTDINGDPILNEDTGIGESGTRDIFITVQAQNEAAQVAPNLLGAVGAVYSGDSDTTYDVSGSIFFTLLIYSTGDTPTHGAGFGLPGEIKSHRDWLSNLTTEHYARPSLDVWFPDDTWPGHWSVWAYDTLKIPEEWEYDGDAYTWQTSPETIAHEYGHAVMFDIWDGSMPSGDFPEGPLDDPMDGVFLKEHTGYHWIYSESSEGFAFTEGWADFFECARYDDPAFGSLERNEYWKGGNGIADNNGNVVEGAVASILWDLWDGGPGDDDQVDERFDRLWTVFHEDKPDSIWNDEEDDDFYHYWSARYGRSRAVDEVFIDHGIPVVDDSYDAGDGNDVLEKASHIGTVTGAAKLSQLILVDDDWYRFTTTASGDASAAVSIEYDWQKGSLDLDVYRADRTLVGSGSQYSPASGFNRGKRVSLDGETPGTFFVKVRPSAPANGDYSPNYSLGIRMAAVDTPSAPDNFGYTYVTSNAVGGPSYDWIDITGTGTQILPNSDDQYVDGIPVGFFFNFYGTDYSQVSITNNGILLASGGTGQYSNQPIGSSTPHNFILPFWDDIVTWNTAGAVYYKTLGTAPNRTFVVEWYDNQHYSSSTSGITFEAILYEGTNNIKFQYQDVSFDTVSGAVSSDLPPYDNGGSATVGIEGLDGQGLQYSYNEQVITPGLAILFKFPAFSGTNMYVSKNAPSTMDRGNTMTYDLYYHNFGSVPASNVVLEDTLPAGVAFVSASAGGAYDAATRKVTWELGSVPAFPTGRGSASVTVSIPEDVSVGTVIQNTASVSTTTLETRYDDNSAAASTRVTGSGLPPGVGIEGRRGDSIYYGDPITFTYRCDDATGVDIRIHIDDGGPDITGSMTGGPPVSSFTTTFYPRYGNATVTYTVIEGNCTSPTFDIYIDPAGYVYDVDTNARIAGASVWLQRPDGEGGWENVPTGESPAIMDPDVNPLITDTDGQYQWDVLAGSYRVHVEAEGYYPADSIVVSIPPAVNDLHVGLTPLPNEAPTADAGPDQTLDQTSPAGAEVTLDGSGSSDPDGDALTYAWTWSGGSAAGETPVVTLPVGTTEVTLEVSDGELSDTDTVSITVTSSAPQADFSATPTSGDEPLAVTFADNSTSIEGIVSWLWDFGDGQTSNEQSPVHTYSDNGTYVAALTVQEADGQTDTATMEITVSNVAPTVDAGPDAFISVGDAFSSTGVFSDPGVDEWTALVDYGDGSGPQTLALNPDKTFALSHSYAGPGVYTVSVTVADDDGGSGIDTVAVEVSVRTYTITATAGDNGAVSPSGAVVVPQGTDQTFDITADNGYHTADVLVDGVSVGALPSYTFPGVSDDHTIDATFAPDEYSLAIAVSGNGSVSRDPDNAAYGYGSTVTLTAEAAPGWVFAGWGGDLSGSASPVTITMDGNKAVSATFVMAQKMNTSVRVRSSANPSVFGQRVTLTALVKPESWRAGLPTGAVSFMDGDQTLATVALKPSYGLAYARFSTRSLSVGAHSITVVYNGNGNFNSSISSAVIEQVNKARTTVRIVSSPRPSTYGQPVTFTATVRAKAPGSGTPAGTVIFRHGSTVIGTATLDASGRATCTIGTLPVGFHRITAAYTGDASFKGSTSWVYYQRVRYR